VACPIEEIREEITKLERLRQKRAGKPGFGENVQDIDARLAIVKAELSDG
jgi:hypothetical protein